ncbi:MAG TPA: caspase family protein, partial [Myxococcales bacterium]|nr:caspase family protein [Myxococcales bacterium]
MIATPGRLVLLTLLLARPVLAETRRVAIIAGNNTGGPLEKPLHYAEEDASKVADVLAQLGDVHPDDLLLLKGQGRKELQEAAAHATELIAGYRHNPDDRTVLFFYYSGHSDSEALELGSDRVTYTELREWLRDTKADVRVLVADGCKSGSLVSSKGGKPVPPFEIKLTDQLDATGEAILTSSAADELALESREIRGSFFTHHFVSGLRGAADASGDGRITLAEAYQYAFSHTLSSSSTAGVRQHP